MRGISADFPPSVGRSPANALHHASDTRDASNAAYSRLLNDSQTFNAMNDGSEQPRVLDARFVLLFLVARFAEIHAVASAPSPQRSLIGSRAVV